MTQIDILIITDHVQKTVRWCGLIQIYLIPNYWFCISILLEGYLYYRSSYTVVITAYDLHKNLILPSDGIRMKEFFEDYPLIEEQGTSLLLT